jgi:hypothetical protein
LASTASAPGLAFMLLSGRAAADTPCVWSALALIPHAVSPPFCLHFCCFDFVAYSLATAAAIFPYTVGVGWIGSEHRYLIPRLSLKVVYLWRHVSSTAPPFILWWCNLETLFAPLNRSSPFIGELRCQAIQMEHALI